MIYCSGCYPPNSSRSPVRFPFLPTVICCPCQAYPSLPKDGLLHVNVNLVYNTRAHASPSGVISLFYCTVLATRIILLPHYCTATGLRFTRASLCVALRIQLASHFDLVTKTLLGTDGWTRRIHASPRRRTSPVFSRSLPASVEMEKTFCHPLLYIRPLPPSIEDVSLGSVLF